MGKTTEMLIHIVLETMGISSMLGIGIKFLGNKFFDGLMKNYEFRLKKQFELFKEELNNQSYEKRADYEEKRKVCRELIQALTICSYDAKKLDPEREDYPDSDAVIDIKKHIDEFEYIIQMSEIEQTEDIKKELKELVNLFNVHFKSNENLFKNTEDVEIDDISPELLEKKGKETVDMLMSYYYEIKL